jgi:rhamnulokinase
MPINTVFQLAAMVEAGDPALEAAQTLLLVPDLLHHWLGGPPVSELTNATTTACFDPRAGAWATDLVERLGIPGRLLPEVVGPGSVLGALRPEVADDTRLRGTVVAAPGTHDTASAVAATPFRHEGSAYISAGTWSLVGIEVDDPVIDDRTFAANLTNEGGVGDTFRLLRNVTGLWLLHECRRAWSLDGRDWSFEQLVELAEGAPALRSLVDPDDPSLAAPGDDMPGRIGALAARTGQPVPESPGEIVRCALESIALKHRHALDLLRDAAGAEPAEVHVVGGGARNRLLCGWTAEATGLPVLAGPEEATLIGNLTLQAIALGELASVEEARDVVRASFEPEVYEPAGDPAWEDAYARFAEIVRSRVHDPEEALT